MVQMLTVPVSTISNKGFFFVVVFFFFFFVVVFFA